jgi:hypothetical protein
MGLIKKIDVDKHFAAWRAMRLGRTGPLSQVGSRREPAAMAKNAPASIAVDAVEHSSPTESERARGSTPPRIGQA